MSIVGEMHFIRKHILQTLSLNKWARFRDMKPKNVDSNIYSYHLKELMKDDFVERVEGKGYRLTPMGLRYVDHVSLESFEPRWQPKLLTKIAVTNEKGDLLMWPKYKQPFIDTWSLPSGKMHYDDDSLLAAAKREVSYFTENTGYSLQERGVVEISVVIEDEVVTHALEHIFSMTLHTEAMTHAKAVWMNNEAIASVRCSPGTREVITMLQHDDDYIHQSITVDW